MIRRHPHVFGEGESAGWENIKAAERASSSQHGALEGVALALPALKRAEKLQKRAARVGFDWPDDAGPRDKVLGELKELDEAAPHEHRIAEQERKGAVQETNVTERENQRGARRII